MKLLCAAALAALVAATPALCETGTPTVPRDFVAPQASLLGLRRNLTGRGVALRQMLTTQSALALSASTGNRRDLPEVRVLLGVQYTF